MRTVLEKMGDRVLISGNGSEGLVLHQNDRIDLSIQDMIMPDTEGIEMIANLTEESPDAKITGMTDAVGDMNFLDAARPCGVHHVVAKPCDRDALVLARIIHERFCCNADA